jgi:hypothetical protein
MKDLMTLKHQIERGEYRISNERIAEAIVARLAEQPNPLDSQNTGQRHNATSSSALAA